MLEIKLFGQGTVNYFGRRLVGFPSHLPSLLLCYLILNRQHPQNREHIAASFWGEFPPPTARKCLRNAIWRLRLGLQAIGAVIDDYFLIDDEYVSFIQSSSYSLDVELFENVIIESQDIPGTQLSAGQVSRLESAVDLYSGDLLESVYEDWCLYARERLHLLNLNALYKLMMYHGQQENFERGISYGERILALDRVRENVHCQVMLFHWLSGDRSAAIAQYHLCAQILRDEIGIAPAEQTRQLYEKIIHSQAEKTRGGNPSDLLSQPKFPPKPSTSSVQHILHELHHLQGMIDEAMARSQLLEKLIDETLNRSETQMPGLEDT